MDPELEGSESRTYTRGKVLKRAGVGAAALWAVPAFVSTSAAGAGTDAFPGKICITTAFQQGLDCPCDTCLNGNIVNTCSAGGCVCFVDVTGKCQCRGLSGGCGNPTCTSNGQCPSGWKCVLTCCDGGGQNLGRRCLPPCTGDSAAPTRAELALIRA